jgi:hypothetical protein
MSPKHALEVEAASIYITDLILHRDRNVHQIVVRV